MFLPAVFYIDKYFPFCAKILSKLSGQVQFDQCLRWESFFLQMFCYGKRAPVFILLELEEFSDLRQVQPHFMKKLN